VFEPDLVQSSIELLHGESLAVMSFALEASVNGTVRDGWGLT